MIYPSGALTIKFIMFQVHFKSGQSSVLLAWQLQRFYHAWFLRKLKISCNKSTNDPSHSWQTRNTFYISQCSSSSLDNYKCARYPTLRDSNLNCGVVSPVAQVVQYPGMIPSSGMKNPRQKVVPPNVTVVSQ